MEFDIPVTTAAMMPTARTAKSAYRAIRAFAEAKKPDPGADASAFPFCFCPTASTVSPGSSDGSSSGIVIVDFVARVSVPTDVANVALVDVATSNVASARVPVSPVSGSPVCVCASTPTASRETFGISVAGRGAGSAPTSTRTAVTLSMPPASFAADMRRPTASLGSAHSLTMETIFFSGTMR